MPVPDISALLSFTDQQLKETLKRASETILPNNQFMSFRYLTMVQDGLGDLNSFRHWYEQLPSAIEEGCIDIIHGHTVGRPCFTPNFCHEYGFWPEQIHKPTFRKLFKMKWEKLYADVK